MSRSRIVRLVGMTLVIVEGPDNDDDDDASGGVEDAFDRLSRFS